MHSLPTVLIPFPSRNVEAVESYLDRLGNPAACPVRDALHRLGTIHFMSISAIDATSPDGGTATLVLEASADGGMREALTAIAGALEAELHDLFQAAGIDEQAPELASFLFAHEGGVGQGWGARTLGLPFIGTPGMTVRRIRREAMLVLRIARMTGVMASDKSALAKLDEIRAVLWRRGDLKWAFVPEAIPHLDARAQSKMGAVGRTLPPVLFMLLWPVPALALMLCLFVPWLLVLAGLLVGLPAATLMVFVRLRQLERSNTPNADPPDAGHVGLVMSRENIAPQNLMVTISEMQPGWVRRFTLRIAFVVIGQIAKREFHPGFLADLGTVHFARWLLLPGGRKLAFISSYDGSVESYLEDFIQEASEGVTGIWSNTLGFPRTRMLFLDGARDGDRLRQQVLRQQIQARFWYSAYPLLTAARIRANAQIVRGLASKLTRDQAEDWLAAFGASGRLLPSRRSARPRALIVNKVESWAPATPKVPLRPLETDSIPTLLFGGRSRLPYSTAVLLDLAGGAAQARSWLSGIAPAVTFGRDGTVTEVLALALSARALDDSRLALPPSARRSFSPAFLNGMSALPRARALGDVGADAPAHWAWGGPKPVDVVLVLCDDCAARLERRVGTLQRDAVAYGHRVVDTVVFAPLVKGRMTEPFGFVDGISQPTIRGIDPNGGAGLHEAGEFILGYRDNPGFLPPSPVVKAHDDPARVLPRAAMEGWHDLGRNGSYLVVRQLDQDAQAFKDACDRMAAATRSGPSSLSSMPAAFVSKLIAAKMIGRWPNGSALAQHPAYPGGAGERNDFQYGFVDAAGQGCPLGAHIRRANPRDSLKPGSDVQLALANRHRLLRVGRRYDPSPGNASPGLFFMCLNADIGRQFEFVQQTWLLGRNFHGLDGEGDPLLQPGGRKRRTFTVHTPNGPLRLSLDRQFVTVRGGEYFFMPSREALHFLAGAPAREAPMRPAEVGRDVVVPSGALSHSCTRLTV